MAIEVSASYITYITLVHLGEAVVFTGLIYAGKLPYSKNRNTVKYSFRSTVEVLTTNDTDAPPPQAGDKVAPEMEQ